MQMKLIMTRLGQNSKMVIDGDLGQSDIGTINGLAYLTAKLKVNPVEDIALVEFDKHDIMRNKLIEEIEKLFTNKYNLEGVVHSNKD
jgi:phosphate starvation-inducible PhoH-like protein